LRKTKEGLLLSHCQQIIKYVVMRAKIVVRACTYFDDALINGFELAAWETEVCTRVLLYWKSCRDR